MGDAGKVLAFAGATPGTGWLLCDGASYLRATYPDLFGEIGTSYGAVDATHFNVPDLRGKHALGKAVIGTGSTIGESGGSLAHTHAGPAHLHTVTQPATHSAHVVTQPAAHTDLTHAGLASTDHGSVSHTGQSVASHSVTESSSHGTHASSGTHNHDSHFFFGLAASSGSSKFGGPSAHSNASSHTHDSHSAHTETVSGHTETQASAHSVSAHSPTQPATHASITHTAAAVDAHGAHVGMSTTDNQATTGTGDAPWLALNYIIGTGDQPAPAGTVVPGGLGAPPANHVLCDGTSYTTASQPALFAAIGYAYGGSGLNFNVPDLRGRHVLGKAAAGTGSALGNSGGAVDHTHAGGSHTHPVTQATTHAAHTVTQPATHSLTHTGAAFANHSDLAHTGFSVASHTVTQSSGHGTHSTTGDHDHDDHTFSGSSGGVGGAAGGKIDHTNSGDHNHDAHSSHSGAALSSHTETQGASHTTIAHSVTQPDAHSLTHTGANLDAHGAHAGASADAGGTGASGTGEAPYLGLHHYIKTAVSVQPIGTLFAIGRAAAPVGSLLADGSSVLRADYPSLFTAIGTTFGAVDGTHFTLPDMRGRIPRGTGGPALAAAGGALDHVHTAPSHTHPTTQPSAHAAHVATQPSSHGTVTHAGAGVAAHSLTHSGMSVASHTATQASSHGTHSSEGGHTHGAHETVGASDFGGGVTHMSSSAHTTDGSHTHGAHTAHTGFGVNAHSETQAATHSLSHTTTQPSSHAPTAHASFAVDGHSAHTGFTTVAGGATATGAANPPYLVVSYAIQALTDIEVHSGQASFSEGDSFDVTAFVVTENPVPTTPPSSPTIYVLNASSLAVLGIIERAARVSVTRRLWGVDTIDVELDAAQAYADQIVNGVLLYLPRIDNDAPLAFLVETVAREETAKGAKLNIAGRTMDGIATVDRLCYPTVGLSHDTQTSVPLETAIKHYVDGNAGATAAANRQVPNFVVATSAATGITVSAAARYQRVIDVILELGYLGGMGWKCTFEAGTNDHVFEVLSGTDRSASVFFDFAFDTVEAWQEVASTLDSKSLVVVGGQGEGAARDIEVRPAVEPTGLARREAFMDARDVDLGNAALLQQRGDAFLAASSPETTLEVTPRQFGAFRYTQEWHLGDIVLVRNERRGLSRSARVIEVTITADESAAVPTIGAVLDRAEPTLRDRVEGPFGSAQSEGGALTMDHNDLTNVTSDQHHAKAHVHLADGSGTVAHSSLSGITATDHHAAAAAGPDASITVDSAGAAGTAGTFARSAHGHQLNTSSATPAADSRAGSAGATAAVARGQHTHPRIAPIRRVYTASTTWTKPAGLDYAEVEVQGGGGAAGGCDASAAGEASVGAGGGGGGYAKKRFSVEDLAGAASFTVTVGGTRAGTSSATGSAGNASSFSGTGITSVVGNGGAGGEYVATGTTRNLGEGGVGGTATGGDYNIPGGEGGMGGRLAASSQVVPSYGGSSHLGSSAKGITASGAGRAGSNYGGGGAGAYAQGAQTAQAGGAGAQGIVIVTEYYF